MRIQSSSTSRHGLKRLAALFVLIGILGLYDQVGAETDRTPTVVVQKTMNELLYVLTELRDPSRAAQRTWEFEQAVRRHFRYEDMAKRSLGEVWERVGVTDRRQFVRLYAQVLRDELAARLQGYSVSEVAYLAERLQDGRAEVDVAMTSADLETKLEFSMSRISGDWSIDDVRLDGASLVERYQAQFARILKDATFGDLMERLKQRTLLVEAFEKAGS
jgi:phospholipid transport system substrate-binding protein